MVIKNTLKRPIYRRTLAVLVPPLVLSAGFVGFWYLVSFVILNARVRFILPPPHEVLQDGILNWRSLDQTLEGLWLTSQVTLLGFAIAIFLGVCVAILMSQARWIERTLFPYAVVLQAVPIVAIVPLIGLWTGYGFKSKLIVAVIIAIFPIITNTLFGLLSVEKSMHDLFKLHIPTRTIESRILRFRKLQFRAAVPSIFTGLRISAGLALVGTIVGEFFFRSGAEKGLGRLIVETYKPVSGKAPELYTAILITCLLGVCLFGLVSMAGKYFTRYLTTDVSKK